MPPPVSGAAAAALAAALVAAAMVAAVALVLASAVRSQDQAPLRLIGTPGHGEKVRLSWNRLNPHEYLPCCMPSSNSDFEKGTMDDCPMGKGLSLTTP